MLPWMPAKTAVARLRFWVGVGICALGIWALSGQLYDWLRAGQAQTLGQQVLSRSTC